MNPQYFGDAHDLFKYDLICTIMDQLRTELTSFIFIPMLTKNHPPTKKGVAGRENENLWKHFNKLFGDEIATNYFKEIKQFFESEGITTNIFSDSRFTHINREEYFKSVFSHVPEKTLVFLDPDTGLKEEKATEKHLKYSELRHFITVLDNSSLLMVYQHFFRDRKKYSNFPEEIASQVDDKIGQRPLWLSDNSIMFIFLTKNKELRKKLENILTMYKERYPVSFQK